MPKFGINKLKSISTNDLETAIAEAIAKATGENVEISVSDTKYGNHFEPSELNIKISHTIEASFPFPEKDT